MILKDHGIKDICFPRDCIFKETEKGLWLDDNNVDYRVSTFEESIALNIDDDLEKVIIIKSIDFFNEVDFTAFKLRWSD